MHRNPRLPQGSASQSRNQLNRDILNTATRTVGCDGYVVQRIRIVNIC